MDNNNKLFVIAGSEQLTDERITPNWHCVIKPIKTKDHSVTIDVWGHKLTQLQCEKVATAIVNALNDEVHNN